MNKRVAAVIVLHKPNVQKLVSLIGVLKSLSIDCFVIDNTPPNEIHEASVLTCQPNYIALGSNEGIARAQNIGIKKAIQNDADILILLDQDSEVSKNCLQIQIDNIVRSDSEISVPTLIDRKEGFEYPHSCVNRFGLLTDRYRSGKTKPFQIDMAISSGSVISANVFQKVGYFEESFFIDFVDIEWYFRCWSNGVLVKSDPRAIMFHSIGQRSVKRFGVRTIVHSSQRNYFKLRNPFRLLKIKTVPKVYAVNEIFAGICHSVVQIPLSDNPLAHVKYSLRGLRDGLMILFFN